MNVVKLLAKWSARISLVKTGGGCEAWRIDDVAQHRYYLITDEGGCTTPDVNDDGDAIAFGVYPWDGNLAGYSEPQDDEFIACSILSADEIDAILDDAIHGGIPGFTIGENKTIVPRDRHETAESVGMELPSPSVAEYFALAFDRYPARPSLLRLPVRSPCGNDCRRAIDAGHALVSHVRAASGGDVRVITQIAAIVEAVIDIYDAG